MRDDGGQQPHTFRWSRPPAGELRYLWTMLLLVYLEAYQRGAANARPIVALLSLFRGDEKVFETQPLPVVGGMDTKSRAIPIRFSVPLAGIETGRYECQVTVLDPETGKAAFWRHALAVVP